MWASNRSRNSTAPSSESLVNRLLSFARACRQASVQAKPPNSIRGLVRHRNQDPNSACLNSEDAQKMEGFWQQMPSSGGQGSSWYRHEKTEYSKYSRADRFLKDVDRRHQNR
jgi:hypothetical protein